MKPDTQERIIKDEVNNFFPREPLYFVVINSFLFLLSVAFLAYHVSFDATPKHGLLPTLLAKPFTDLNSLAPNVRMVHESEFFTYGVHWIYPAPCIFIYKILLLGDAGALPSGRRASEVLYLGLVCAGLFMLMRGMVTALKKLGINGMISWLFLGVTASISWPIFLGVRQGNIEAILWMGVAVAVWACFHDRWWVAAVLLGLVAGFKIYPILLLGLFLKAQRYKEIAVSILVFTLFTLASLAYIGPTVPTAFYDVREGIKVFTDLAFYPAAIDRNYLALEHSLLSLFRILTTAHPEYMSVLSRYYMPSAAVIMSAFFFIFLWKMPRTNQLLAIVLAIVLLPPKSYDYTLEMLYIPWACLVLLAVSSARQGLRVPGLSAAMVLLALICSPEIYIRFNNFYSAGQFKTICLLGLLLISARYPFDIRLAERKDIPIACTDLDKLRTNCGVQTQP